MAEALKSRVASRTTKATAPEPADGGVPDGTPPPEPPQSPPPAPVPSVPEPAASDPECVPVQVALARVMAEVRAVGKAQLHKSATAGTWRFRGIDDVINAVGPALRNHGVIALPQLQEVTYRDVQTSGGKPSRECTVRVRYVFVGPDGSTLEATVPGESMDHGDKGTAKAMSVALRIALLQALALPTDDPDPDSQAYQRAPASAPPKLPIELAKEALRDACADNKINTRRAAEVFAVQYGVSVADCTDAGQVRAFTAALVANPAHVLGEDQPA
jgi:hypothetical protein